MMKCKVYRFLRWYITISITGFLDFVHHVVLLQEHSVLDITSVLVLDTYSRNPVILMMKLVFPES
jgi:hypothetical protein